MDGPWPIGPCDQSRLAGCGPVWPEPTGAALGPHATGRPGQQRRATVSQPCWSAAVSERSPGHARIRIVSRTEEVRSRSSRLVPALHAGPVRARLQHRLATVHQLVQRGVGSCRRPAERAGQLAVRAHKHGVQEPAGDLPPPRLPCNPTAWRSTAVGSGPLEWSVSAIRRASSPRGAWRKSSGSPRAGSSRPAGRGRGTRPARRPAADPTRPAPCAAARPSSPIPAARLGPTRSPRAAWAARSPPHTARAGPHRRWETAVRSPRPPQTSRPGRCCGSGGRSTTSAVSAWPRGRPCRDCTTSLGTASDAGRSGGRPAAREGDP
jgi:hypothetical protein